MTKVEERLVRMKLELAELRKVRDPAQFKIGNLLSEMGELFEKVLLEQFVKVIEWVPLFSFNSFRLQARFPKHAYRLLASLYRRYSNVSIMESAIQRHVHVADIFYLAVESISTDRPHVILFEDLQRQPLYALNSLIDFVKKYELRFGACRVDIHDAQKEFFAVYDRMQDFETAAYGSILDRKMPSRKMRIGKPYIPPSLQGAKFLDKAQERRIRRRLLLPKDKDPKGGRWSP